MSAFLMPSLGADMEAATLVEQLIEPGAAVKHGDIIAAVETQKGVIEIEAFEDGVLKHWLVTLGTKVPVGTPLAVISTKGEHPESALSATPDGPNPDKPEVPQPQDPAPTPDQPEDPAPYDPSPQPPNPEVPTPDFPDPEIQWPTGLAGGLATEGKQRLRATPAARRLAAQSGVDLQSIRAKNTGAPISRADIAAIATATQPQHQPLTEMRTAIAAAMSRSKREIPHYYLSHQADLTSADAFVKKTNTNRPPESRLLIGALYLKAVATAAKKVPEMNGYYQNDRFQHSQDINVGLAISLRGGGLVAPAILNTGSIALDDLMAGMVDLVSRVRAGRFRSRELSDATITLTSLGDRAVNQLYGVIYPPQVAIVGIGTPMLRPWVHEGQIVTRLVADITLAADHRVSDGRRGALFLKTIADSLFRPESL